MKTNAMRRALVAGWAMTWLLAGSAEAQPVAPAPERGEDARAQHMGPGPHRQQARRGEGSGQGARAARFEAGDGAAAPRGQWMSREERRQLRRDVDEAGRDLYPQGRHGGHRPPPAQ